MTQSRVGFVFVVESGTLEYKAQLLAESLRTFGGNFSTAPVWAVQPRKDNPLSSETLDAFERWSISFISEECNTGSMVRYGISNKVYASAMIDSQFGRTIDLLCFLDTDILCLGSPDNLILSDESQIALRPVDIQGIGNRVNNPINNYWQYVYDKCGVRGNQLWPTSCTVDNKDVWAYFNSGVVCARSGRSIFQRWLNNLLTIFEEFRTDKFTKEKFHLDQAALAGTVMALFKRDEVFLLSNVYNYPLHLHGQDWVTTGNKVRKMEDIVFCHYHSDFTNSEWLNKIELSEELKNWIVSRKGYRHLQESDANKSYSETL